MVKIQTRDEFKGSQAKAINQLLAILYALLALAIVIAILGIINTLALSVVERRREIGMLRAVGMLRAQVRRAIYLESTLIAVFGAIVGVALGLELRCAVRPDAAKRGPDPHRDSGRPGGDHAGRWLRSSGCWRHSGRPSERPVPSRWRPSPGCSTGRKFSD